MIGTLEIGSYFWTLIIYTISLLISLIFITVCCVCNPKSKHYFQQKHILSNEFNANNKNDDNVDGDGGGQIIDRSNHQVTSSPSPHRIITNQDDMVILNSSTTTIKQPLSLNRALPDIPQQSIKSNDNNDAQNKQTSSSSSTAAAANSSTVNVEINDKSCSNDNHQHSNIDDKNLDDNHEDHAYARIRNLITTTDSSTDTDNDYSDPNSIVVVQNPPLTPNHSRADHELPISPSDRMIRSSENVDEMMLLNNHQMIEPKREISYNTISVREPLAKVLAERENHNNLNNLNLEHHYNEVEDVDCMERLSSFYEEINSDNSSATYSKINETLPPSSSTIAQNNHCQPSTSNSEMMVNENSANNLPLYAFVDKKSKKFQNNNDSNTGDATNVFIDNLYTKVMKPKKENHSALQRYSQPPPPPPPLPPPLNKDHQQQQHRNTIIFVDAIPSTSSYLSSNEQQQQIMMNDDEKDPGYETVYKEINQNHHNDHGHHSNVNEIDYGYEAIQNDPAYEIVSSSSTMTTTTGLDNGYEIIKNHNNYYHYHRFNNNDNDDDQIDEQSDPNYEIISNIKSTTSTSTNNTTTVIINTGQSSLSSSSILPLPAQSSSTSITNIQIVNNNNNRSNNTLSDDDNFVIIEHL